MDEQITIEIVEEVTEITIEVTEGSDGLSAYELAVQQGFEGTLEEWLDSLVGPQGIQGEQGLAGSQGLQGIQGEQGLTGSQGPQGVAGKSAYQSYLDTTTDNPVMTEQQWSNQLGDIQTLLESI